MIQNKFSSFVRVIYSSLNRLIQDLLYLNQHLPCHKDMNLTNHNNLLHQPNFQNILEILYKFVLHKKK